ncbi:MAG: hypothetical protein EA362_10575 [Saprospirales bacterium]|nr:MAG: hypothetical protein EA362_10575 [Saprospirales bacterium]
MRQMKKEVFFSLGFMFFAFLWMLGSYLGSGGIQFIEGLAIVFLFSYGLVWLLLSLDVLPQNNIIEVDEDRIAYKPDIISPKVNLKIGDIEDFVIDRYKEKIRFKLKKGETLILDFRKLGLDEMEKWVAETKS